MSKNEVTMDSKYPEYTVAWTVHRLYKEVTILEEITSLETVKQIIQNKLATWLEGSTTEEYVESVEQEFKHD